MNQELQVQQQQEAQPPVYAQQYQPQYGVPVQNVMLQPGIQVGAPVGFVPQQYQPTTTVVYNQQEVLPFQANHMSFPIQIICPACKTQCITNMHTEIGAGTYTLSYLLFLCTGQDILYKQFSLFLDPLLCSGLLGQSSQLSTVLSRGGNQTILIMLIIYIITYCICAKEPTEMKQPLTVDGKVSVSKNCMFGEILSEGGIEAESLKTKKLEAKVLKTKLLKVGTLQAKKQGHPIVMNGSIAVTKIAGSSTDQKVLLQTVQWDLLHHLDFNDEPLSKCESLKDGHFLGGYCENTNQTLSKTFTGIPAHSSVRVEVSLHVFDQWEQESITMSANDQVVWSNRFENTIHHVNLCGNSRFGDQINIPILKVFNHQSNSLTLTFKALTPKSTCEASFAIDNLIISYR